MLGETFSGTFAAARVGAEWAWATIYRDLSPVVLGYLRARRATEPEELTGEVFLQVVRDLRASPEANESSARGSSPSPTTG